MKKTESKKGILILGILLIILAVFSVGLIKPNEKIAFAEEVYTNTPVITVLTGGSPLDRNNDNSFDYSRDSSGQFMSSSFEYRTDT